MAVVHDSFIAAISARSSARLLRLARCCVAERAQPGLSSAEKR